ncbi:MAG: hypothetical protein MMC33_007914 [Icmadophila ericetorum]|nr:hypothetical protein [Icmadophila ericetorum]
MSDSSLSDIPVTDEKLEQALRQAVKTVYENGDLDNLTVKRMRIAAEEDLGLDAGFFKEGKWKDTSKRIIEEEAEVQGNTHDKQPTSSQTASQPVSPVKPKKATPTAPKPSKKRSSPEESKPRKRQRSDQLKKVEIDDAASDASESPKKKPVRKKAVSKAPRKSPSESPVSDAENSEPSKPSKPSNGATIETKTKAADPESELSELTDSLSKPKKTINMKAGPPESKSIPIPAIKATPDAPAVNSESELSELIDSPPKPKRSRKKKSGSTEAKPKPATKAKKEKKPAKEEEKDLDKEEIKRLQGWLVKCGIRKMWFRELAPYEKTKDKIRHLKEMLSDAGMTGRYSVEKATQIKEARELKSELEAVQEGAKHWGKADDEEENGGEDAKPKRRLAKGLQALDFLNDDDGEETD